MPTEKIAEVDLRLHELRLRVQHLRLEKDRLAKRTRQSRNEINDHINGCLRSIKRFEAESDEG